MGDGSDYGAQQQPSGGYGGSSAGSAGYGPSQNPPSPYGGMQQKGTTSQPTSSGTAPQSSAQQVADQMADLLSKIYLKRFSKYNVDRVGKKVPVILATEPDLEAALRQHALDVADQQLQSMLKFNPEWVIRKLQDYYRVIEKPFPYAGKVFDENTKITREEKAAIFALVTQSLVSELQKDLKVTQGFYSRPKDRKGMGTIFIRKEYAEDIDRRHDLAGTLAHELAHAYAEITWWDFVDGLSANGMPKVGALIEGMATHFERIIVYDWFNDQPAGTLIPLAGYRDEPDVKDTADEFLKAVGEQAAYQAYLGGWIWFTDIRNPQDSILVGKAKKNWRWPWR
jgi:hypothetical protein